MTAPENVADWPDLDDPGSWLPWANNWRSLRALNMTCVAVTAQHGEFVIEEMPFPPNPNDSVNGGMLAAAADQVFGVMGTLSSPPGSIPATATLHMSYHRPATLPLRFRAQVLPGGRRTKFIEVVIESATGDRCATAQGSMAVAGGGPR